MKTHAQLKGLKSAGFVLLVISWVILTCFCYYKIIVFESTTLGGAMLHGFILLSSIMGMLRLLKMIYDTTYSALVKEDD